MKISESLWQCYRDESADNITDFISLKFESESLITLIMLVL